MAKNKFSDYVTRCLSDDVLKRVRNFCRRSASHIIYNDDRYAHLSRIEYVGIDDVGIKCVKVWDYDEIEDGICFEVIVNPVIAFLADFSGHYDIESDSYSGLWLRVQYLAKIGQDGLENVTFNGIDEYDPSRSANSLDGSLVPYIRKEQFDEEAKAFLRTYSPESLGGEVPVDPYLVAERMGLRIIERRIKKDKSVFGLSVFVRADIPFYDEETDSCREESVDPNTIVIDRSANHSLSFNSINITIIHECLHFYLHTKAVRFARVFDHRISSMRCLSTGSLDNPDEDEDFKFAEIQANAIAPCVLMPRKRFIDALREEEETAQILVGNKIEDYGPLVIKALAERFGVTVYAAKKRLIDLGYETAQGMLEFADGKYVKPYRFAKGSLKEGETFTVSFSDLANGFNQYVFGLFFNGTYRFIENHVVFNSPKFIKDDGELTDYARVHLDECAVRFKIRTKSAFFAREFAAFATFCYLCRGIKEDMTFEIISAREPNKIPDMMLARQESEDRIRMFYAELVSKKSVCEKLKYLMREFKMNQAALTRRSHLSERTISRYLREDKCKYDLRSMVAICLAFNLPPKLSDVLISSACGKVPDNDEDRIEF